MGDLWAVLIFVLVMAANAVSSYNKNQREKQKRQKMLTPKPVVPKQQPAPPRQQPKAAPAPQSKTPPRTLFPERKTSPQGRSPQSEGPRREVRKAPPQRTAPAPSQQRPEPETAEAPDWGEIFGDAFKGLEEVLRGPQSQEVAPAPAPPRQRSPERRDRTQRARTDIRRRKPPVQKQRPPQTKREMTTKEPVSEIKIPKPQPVRKQPLSSSQGSGYSSLLLQPQNLKQAIILSEIIGPPMAKRPPGIRRI